MIHLDKRLSLVASFVRKDKIVCDVGTDHALLPCFLRGEGVDFVMGTDINDGPLEAARETINRYGVDGIKLIKSDGLAQVDYCEDLIIAGMGGQLIARIISECKFIHKDLRLILQPMSRAFEVRKQLYALGFEIIREKTTFDGGKGYVVIYAQPSTLGTLEEIDENFAFIGKVEDKDYIKWQISILQRKVEGLKCSHNQQEKIRETERLLEYLKQRLKGNCYDCP